MVNNLIKIIFLFFYCHTFLFSQVNNSSDWILVWSDEFDGESVDLGKWNIEDADLGKNNEEQYYDPQEVYLKNGCLYLRSSKRKKNNKNFTSGLVDTKHKKKFSFGRFEVRAKVSKGQGIWPAIWLMNASETYWPPEIDIMELLGNEPNKVYMTNHFGLYPENNQETRCYEAEQDFSKDFHVFTLEWEKNIMSWYIDGIKRFSVKDNIPKDVSFYCVLNTAVGGDWPGYPDKTTVFPQHFVIDYIRFYKRDITRTCLLSTHASHGKIIKKPDLSRYPVNSQVSLKAVANIGYKFLKWEGNLVSNNHLISVIMNQNKTIRAKFIKDPLAPQLLSENKNGYSSSNENEELNAQNAFDGQLNTRWSSEFMDKQWIYVDLGKTYNIGAIRINWEKACASSYEVEVSGNAKNWEQVYVMKDNKTLMNEIRLEKVNARFVKMSGIRRKTQWGFSIREFEVFGK